MLTVHSASLHVSDARVNLSPLRVAIYFGIQLKVHRAVSWLNKSLSDVAHWWTGNFIAQGRKEKRGNELMKVGSKRTTACVRIAANASGQGRR